MRSNINCGGFALHVFKGVVIAILITLVSVLIFAFVLSLANLPDKVISPINQIIKTASILIGVFFTVKDGQFLLKGGLIGLLSALFTFLLFLMLANTVTSWLSVFIDIGFGFLIGCLSGLLVGKLRSW